MSEKIFWRMSLVVILGLVGGSFAQVLPTFFGKSTTGVYGIDGQSRLRGSSAGGDLVQLIWVGENGRIDSPDEFGNATADDVIVDSVHVGYGYPANANEGKFGKTFSHELLAPGAIVYMRAWNAAHISGFETSYGDSDVHEILADFEEHDFGSWSVLPRDPYPIELAAFSGQSIGNGVELRWVTESETENLGFHVYRSGNTKSVREQISDQMIQGAVNSQTRNEYIYTDRSVEGNNLYFYWLADISTTGHITLHGPAKVETSDMPQEYVLKNNYPNPFNPTTRIDYSIKDQGYVRLTIYNITGQIVRRLVDRMQFVGSYTVEWDGLDSQGISVPSGTYLYTLEVNDFKQTRKMTFMK
ncbi:T9SS type A sorting domain-containing protein [candidate division KSB1 bacterium]|nr:T9SS type A sorting domain-containing protein [candidate division KSB1 bacterium]